jgi:chromosome segregation ATPase
MFENMDKEIKNNLYTDILNSQPHNELLDCVKRTSELKERFSGRRLNKVNCTKEKIVNAFLGLYEKNKIIEKMIMDMGEEEGGNEMSIKGTNKVINIKSSNETKAIGYVVSNIDKTTEDLMDFSLREFISNINQLKSENEKLKSEVESRNTEVTKHKDKIENNNTEIVRLNDKLKIANSSIKEKNSLIVALSTRMDKLEKNLKEKAEDLEKEVKKVVPAVDRTRELVDKNNNTLKEILVNVKEERKSLSKLQEIESEMKGIENKIAEKVLGGIKAVIQNLYMDKVEICIDKNEQNHDLLGTPSHSKAMVEIETAKKFKQEIIAQEHSEGEEDELSKMLNDIKSIIM